MPWTKLLSFFRSENCVIVMIGALTGQCTQYASWLSNWAVRCIMRGVMGQLDLKGVFVFSNREVYASFINNKVQLIEFFLPESLS